MAGDITTSSSLALQYGAPAEVLRRALMRDPKGRAIGPLGVALDIVGSAVNPADEVTQA